LGTIRILQLDNRVLSMALDDASRCEFKCIGAGVAPVFFEGWVVHATGEQFPRLQPEILARRRPNLAAINTDHEVIWGKVLRSAQA